MTHSRHNVLNGLSA